ncbi:hypothetical protein TVAG_367440 [Trichomonas vaginalis G3]|uniref:Uncharacterized protein n=1 Tax=Trichomonas vaginalis (strain ATCC PRA-98 / G3) TaxID=412133 RepID=A2F5Q2_TRIV3|nr:hypothetical protein TVAGG3_0977340 [Trichomonas vaginalis G3]EAX99752.1 hypothetical protein TVAG_367440 [Trichomonas vaginalis G3]KAI5489036.1 hypothetical protein TVAGG3_0977340 [Trichomonas vaginalis G3]|eukprot:XP_001312682.1 hypothetical protein [Trichomonas vaginalis G3]
MISSPRRIMPPSVQAPRQFRSSGRAPYVRNHTDPNYEDPYDLWQQKQTLINEMRAIRAEISQLNVEYQDISQYCKDVMEETISNSREYTDKDRDDMKDFAEKSQKRETLQNQVQELETQIQFFKSFFSDDNLEKLKTELEDQTLEMHTLTEYLESLTADRELILSELESSSLEQRIQDNEKLKSLQKHYKQEIKQLKLEAKELVEAVKLVQKSDPIEANQREVERLKAELTRYQNIHIREKRFYQMTKKRNRPIFLTEEELKPKTKKQSPKKVENQDQNAGEDTLFENTQSQYTKAPEDVDENNSPEEIPNQKENNDNQDNSQENLENNEEHPTENTENNGEEQNNENSEQKENSDGNQEGKSNEHQPQDSNQEESQENGSPLGLSAEFQQKLETMSQNSAGSSNSEQLRHMQNHPDNWE